MGEVFQSNRPINLEAILAVFSSSSSSSCVVITWKDAKEKKSEGQVGAQLRNETR